MFSLKHLNHSCSPFCLFYVNSHRATTFEISVSRPWGKAAIEQGCVQTWYRLEMLTSHLDKQRCTPKQVRPFYITHPPSVAYHSVSKTTIYNSQENTCHVTYKQRQTSIL